MSGNYTDNPQNISEIIPYVITEKESIIAEFFGNSKCFFYDTCSFRRHANLNIVHAEYFFKYIQRQQGIIIITRCILMELASYSGRLNQEYIDYLKHISSFGIKVLLIYEEDLFSVMEIGFNTNSVINEYLCWAVRLIKGPASTITDTLEKNIQINNEIIKGKNLDNSSVYKHFFESVRANKVSGDNLGEEFLGICLHVLSHLTGEDDGKFCVITDDKGAASKIDTMFKKTKSRFLGKEIGIFSTPKLVQILYRENILCNPEHLKEILSTGTDGNIVILGTRIYDIRGRIISLSKDELTDLIMQPNGINIFF